VTTAEDVRRRLQTGRGTGAGLATAEQQHPAARQACEDYGRLVERGEIETSSLDGVRWRREIRRLVEDDGGKVITRQSGERTYARLKVQDVLDYAQLGASYESGHDVVLLLTVDPSKERWTVTDRCAARIVSHATCTSCGANVTVTATPDGHTIDAPPPCNCNSTWTSLWHT
jgi:hypothetical protein